MVKHILVGILISLSGIFNYLHAQEGTIVISEILYDSPLYEFQSQYSNHQGGEFIEFYNPTSKPADISGWTLRGTLAREKYIFPSGTIVNPKEFILVGFRPAGSNISPIHSLFTNIPSNGKIFYQNKIILNNTGEKITLLDKDSKVRDCFDNSYTGKNGAMYKWDLDAINDFDKKIIAGKKYRSIQRSNIRDTWDNVQYSSNDYAVDEATPFSSQELSLPSEDWNNNSSGSINSESVFGSTLVGIADVTSTGAATYNIPIALPKGRNGIEPKLSIAYNSQINDGLLGLKWGLSGLSSISLTNKSFYFDKECKAISGDVTNDGIMLDGMRLAKLTDGTYRSETDPFTVIRYNNTSTTSFTVERADGATVTYGERPDAVTTYNSTSYSWHISRIEDKNGNYVTFHYIKKGNESLISRINYTGNSKTGIDPFYTVQFAYNNRNQKRFYYTNGIKNETNCILQSISVSYKKTKIKEYVFLYNHDRLENIKEIFEGGTKSSTLNISYTYNSGSNYYRSQLWGGLTPLLYGDFLGNGRKFALVKEQSTYSFIDITGRSKTTLTGIPNNVDFSKSSTGDLDNDGVDDFVFIVDGQLSVHINGSSSRSSGVSVESKSYTQLLCAPFIRDCDGDGIPEIITASQVNQMLYLTMYSRGTYSYAKKIEHAITLPDKNNPKIFMNDFNGDGKSDFAYLSAGGMRVLYDFCKSKDVKGPFPMSANYGVAADFNGDGMCDFLDKRSNNICAIYYSTQTGFSSENIKSFKNQYPENEFRLDNKYGHDDTYYNACQSDLCFLDYNGDGITEILQICRVYKPENYIFRSHVDRFSSIATGDVKPIPAWEFMWTQSQKNQNDALRTSEMQWITLRNENGRVLKLIDNGFEVNHIGDYLGYGNEQIAMKMKNGECVNVSLHNQENFLVQYITNNGVKTKTTFSYKLLTEDSNYQYKLQNATTSTRDLITPMYVVSSIKTTNGIGGENKQNYVYSNLKYNAQKGILGFATIKSTDEASGTVTEQISEIDDCSNLTLKNKNTYAPDGKLLSQESFNYSTLPPLTGISSGKSYMKYLKEYIVKDGLTGNERKKLYAYNTSGLPTTETDTYNSNKAQKTVSYTYAKVGNINKIAKVTENSVYDQQTPFSKTKEYTYDENGNLLTETIFPGKNLELRTLFAYNKAGLPINITVTDKENNKRITSYEYDADLRFMTKVADPLGHTISKTYYPAEGLLKSETDDQQNQTITYEYDVFGRVNAIRDPWGYEQKITTDWAEKANRAMPANAVSFVKVEKVNTPSQVEFYDALGRKLRTETDSYNSVSKVDYVYNNLGQLVKQSLPYATKDSPKWTEMSYDRYGRVISSTCETIKNSYTYGANVVVESSSTGAMSTKYLDALGNLIELRDAVGNSTCYSYNSLWEVSKISTRDGNTVIEYDEYGRRKSLSDVNAGKTQFTYNAFGELATQTDAKGEIIKINYDRAGRIQSKITAEGTTTYKYNYKGMLVSVIPSKGTSQYYTYNKRGQVTAMTDYINACDYITRFEYDDYGNNTAMTYPSGFKLMKKYTSKGMLEEITQENGSPVWRLDETNAKGQITKYTHGNGIKTVLSFDELGRTQSIQTGKVQNLSYEYDPVNGNLSKRTDLRKNLSESFTYDNLNRLLTYGPNGASKVTMTYSATGNILEKSNLGTYSYHATQKNAVQDITLTNTNTTLPKQMVDYNVFNKVAAIRLDNNDIRCEFTYGPDEERKTMNAYNGSALVSQKIYSGTYEKVIGGYYTTEYNYINTPSGTTAVMINNDGVKNLYYLCKDHQGSITSIVDGFGNIREEYAYDPWGRRRNPQDWSYNNVRTPELLDRGYTMHEHLDVFGVINMNGRIYDPLLSRMMSPDAFVGNPFSTQGYNRYTYCHNNPMAFTDPDGNNPIAWIIAGAIMIGKWYHDGRKANGGEANPLDWDWKNANFVLGVSAGGGGNGIYGGLGWNNNYGVAMGYSGNGVLAGYTQNGSFIGAPIHNTTVDPTLVVEKAINDARATSSWDYSAYSYASSISMGLAADDVTVIGAYDNIAIPFVFVGATAAFLYDNTSLIEKQAAEIGTWLEKKVMGPQGFTYQLEARVDGYYENVRGGTVYLKAGEVWKYGETTKGEDRYTKKFIINGNIKMHPIFFGNQVEIKIQEKIMIYGYVLEHGILPPGNKIFR